MKKKLTVNTLALGNLRQRKKQYRVLIIGIILAMVFSSGTMFFLSSLNASNEEYANRRLGKYYGYLFGHQEYIDIQQKQKDGLIDKYGYAHILGIGYTDDEEKGTAIAWLDEDGKELYYPNIIQGKYPENKGEIALEKDAASRMGIEAKVGEKITLSFHGANVDKYLTSVKEKTYTLVGIFSDKRKNVSGYFNDANLYLPAAFVSEQEEIDAGAKEVLLLYFTPTKKSLKQKVITSDNYESTAFWEGVVQPIFDNMSNDKEGRYGTTFSVNIHNSNSQNNEEVVNSSIVTITLSIVFAVASCVGIINAFTTNLNERKKQIGLLRAVGTTRRQIINIFGRETFIIAGICAPVSVLIAYFAVKLFSVFMGDDFIFIPDFKVLLLSAVISVICVMLASLLPLVSASKITPMQAIRNVEMNRKFKNKKIKTKKSYKFSKLIASRNMKFYRFKQVGVTFILAITILMSSVGLSLLKAEYDSTTWRENFNADYYINKSYGIAGLYANFPKIDKGISNNTVQEIIDSSLFSSVFGYKQLLTYMEVDEYDDYMKIVMDVDEIYRYEEKEFTKSKIENAKPEDYFDIMFSDGNKKYNQLKTVTKTQKDLYGVNLIGFDSAYIESFMDELEVVDGKIDIDKLNSGEEIILVARENIGCTLQFNSNENLIGRAVLDLDDLPNYSDGEKDKIYMKTSLGYKVGDVIKLKTLYSDDNESDLDAVFSDEAKMNISEIYDKEVKIGAIIKPFSLNFGVTGGRDLDIVTTVMGINTMVDTDIGYNYLKLNYNGELTTESDKEATEYLDSMFSGNDYQPNSLYAIDESDKNNTDVIVVAIMSVIILLLSLCASIVNNSLTAQIRENKKMIGTLRAVGASIIELTQSYIRQLFSMFAWGIGIGFLSSILVNVVIKLKYADGDNFDLMLWPSLVICALLILICSYNLYAKIKREMKNSIVENIREL